MTGTVQHQVVVIGYGNSLRGDDMIGRVVVEAIAKYGPPNALAISVTQLMPELADIIADSQAVVFVDARRDQEAEAVEICRLSAVPTQLHHSHDVGPRALLMLAETCYGGAPPAWLVAVPACEFGVSDQLTSAAARRVSAAVCAVQQLLSKISQNEVTYA